MDTEVLAKSMVHEANSRTNPHYLDIISAAEQQYIRVLPSFRLAADLVARSNREHGKDPSDCRMRIAAYKDTTIYLTDIMGMPILKVKRGSEEGAKWHVKCDADLRERGSPSDELEGIRMSAIVNKLFERKSGKSFICNIIENRRLNNLGLISSTLGWGATKIKSEAKLPDNTDHQISLTLAAARYFTQLAADRTMVMPVNIIQEFEEVKRTLAAASDYVEKSSKLYDDEFAQGRWVVMPVECGYMICTMKAGQDGSMYVPSYGAPYELTSPWFFVRQFSELSTINQEMYEQFMGAYTMMRIAEPNWDNFGFVDNAKKIVMGDRVLPNSHAIAYYTSNQLFSGGHCMLIKMLQL
jgi:hypothetical protein